MLECSSFSCRSAVRIVRQFGIWSRRSGRLGVVEKGRMRRSGRASEQELLDGWLSKAKSPTTRPPSVCFTGAFFFSVWNGIMAFAMVGPTLAKALRDPTVANLVRVGCVLLFPHVLVGLIMPLFLGGLILFMVTTWPYFFASYKFYKQIPPRPPPVPPPSLAALPDPGVKAEEGTAGVTPVPIVVEARETLQDERW
ncbi:unnamed protein product [Durusdinium trenchii]|uniref:Uncharacterized protein n=1 Tax=Durusdinium trenchii TaxID=1381693 RepID=A0ABP0NVX0_9DINO